MNQDKIQRVLLYAKHAQEKGSPLTIRELAAQVRIAQWQLFEYIETTPLLKYWTIGEDGSPIRRQGLFLVEYVPHDKIYADS